MTRPQAYKLYVAEMGRRAEYGTVFALSLAAAKATAIEILNESYGTAIGCVRAELHAGTTNTSAATWCASFVRMHPNDWCEHYDIHCGDFFDEPEQKASVHDINENKPHRVSLARCRVCNDEHVAVILADAGLGALECRRCRTMTCAEYPVPQQGEEG